MRGGGSHSETSRSRGVYDVAVLEKALDLLEAVAAGRSLGLSELSARTGVSKASAFRVLSTLERRGYLAKGAADRKYRPGASLLALGLSVVAGLDLVQSARPVLAELHEEFGETVNLGVLSERRVLYLDMIESHWGLRMAARVGMRDPLHSTALGKAILAHLPDDERRRLLAGYRWERSTPRTITTLRALEDELALVRARGYSVDDEENERGARCVGVAVLDRQRRPVAAISVSGPTARLGNDLIPRIGERLRAAAAEVERRLGYGVGLGAAAG